MELAELVARQNKTLRQIETEMGLGNGLLGKYLAGYSQPRPHNYKKMLDYFEVDKIDSITTQIDDEGTLRYHLAQAKKPIADVCRELDIKACTFNNWLYGYEDPLHENYKKLLDYFGTKDIVDLVPCSRGRKKYHEV